jgi:transcriptional regulator with XRE-family HTH domain
MVTRSKPQTVYLREWRKFMGVKAPPCAEALGIDEKSYYRLERETFRISIPELAILADVIGVKISQLFWPTPKPGDDAVVSLDAIAEGATPEKRQAAVWAVRGIMGGK